MAEDTRARPLEIPHGGLSQEALQALIEEFVSRDGTDYGLRERTLESKVREVRALLDRGEARIVFDPISPTANIVTGV